MCWRTLDLSMRRSMAENGLHFRVTAECAVSKARVACMTLPHGVVDTPVFMPVGTQGTMKGVTPEQLKTLPLDCQIMLGNTYHLGSKPGCDVLTTIGGLHQFMKWDQPLLTDSGGFQMVSLLKLAEITEEGVKFRSPHDDSTMLLTPEHSIEIQNVIGADIIMQLDDVVHSLTTGNRVEEAMWRTLRWLDRCINAHHYPNKQNLFGIVQGGLQPELRKQCIKEMTKRDLPGYAIGGLSGGEKKDIFWKIVSLCTDHLPRDKPRYCMGVGFPVDLVVCCALGVDMFDCVFPTRTARFGTALVPWGQLHLKQKEFEMDFQPIDSTCTCVTCTHYTRAALHAIINKDPVSCSLLTLHNLTYHLSLMQAIRKSIIAGHFPKFVQEFMSHLHPSGNYEQWVIDALASVHIYLK